MKAAEKIFEQLESRASAGQLEVTEGSLRIAAEVADFDRLGVAIYRLELEAADLLGEASIESFAVKMPGSLSGPFSCPRGANLAGPCRVGLQEGDPMQPAGASLFELGTPRVPGSPVAAERLARLAENLPSQLTYLLEPLALIEREDGEQFLLMRSAPPRRQAGSIDYYEIRLVGGSRLSLERYGFDRDRRIREGRAMVFTREVFDRLLEDLAEMMAA